MSDIKLGSVVKDMISGFKGIVTAKSIYLNGCERILVEPQMLKDDGSLINGVWFDVQQIEVVQESTKLNTNCHTQAIGGPRKDPVLKNPTTR